MIEGKKVLALTPARGGSKGLPGKNIKNFCGKPLLGHAIDVAQSSKYVDHVCVSTDCPEIARSAVKFGAEAVTRPEELATDTALVVEVVRHLVKKLGDKYDFIVLLEATSPLRSVEQVDSCIESVNEVGVDSAATFSVAEPPPTRLWKIVDGKASTYLTDADPWLPRQLHSDAFRLNGLAYAFRVESFISTGADSIFFGNRSAVVTEGTVVDIDTAEDFTLAELIMRTKNA